MRTAGPSGPWPRRGSARPHDERILDLQAVGFLKSADQGRKSGRFARAAEDLQRAEELGRSRLGVVARVKRLLLEVVEAGDNAAEVLAPHLAPLAPAARIRTLALLLHDLEENRHVKNVTPGMTDAVRGLLARKRPRHRRARTGRGRRSARPLPADLDILYGGLHVAPVLAEWWGAIMRRADGDGLAAVFDVLLDCGGRTAVRAEIDRRLRGARKPHRDPLLLLYLAVIRFQEGQDHDSRRFKEVLEAADPSDTERLRTAAARLARGARGILREALQKFDFSLLDLPPPLFGGGAPPPLSELLDSLFGELESEPDPEPEPDPDPVAEPSLPAFLDALRDGTADASPQGPRQESLFDNEAAREIDALEALIDRHLLRGMPASLLEDIAETARDDPRTRDNLDRTARACEAADLRPGLTREARILLFPRPGAGRHRRGA